MNQENRKVGVDRQREGERQVRDEKGWAQTGVPEFNVGGNGGDGKEESMANLVFTTLGGSGGGLINKGEGVGQTREAEPQLDQISTHHNNGGNGYEKGGLNPDLVNRNRGDKRKTTEYEWTKGLGSGLIGGGEASDRDRTSVEFCLQQRNNLSPTVDYQKSAEGGKRREGHWLPGSPYWAVQGKTMNDRPRQMEKYDMTPISPTARGKEKEGTDEGGVGRPEIEGLTRPESPGDREIFGSQRNNNGSSAGLKAKRLARAGLGKGDNCARETKEGGSPAKEMVTTYAAMLKGGSAEEGKKAPVDSDLDDDNENIVNATLEGEVVRCEFEEEHYEGVVNCFKDSTILVHFLGRPPNEVELRRWLQEIWSGKGWYIDRVRYLGKGYYAVVFDENIRIRDVLKEGPWYFRGGLVLVQPWEPEFSVDHGSYGRHPAWVELCNLPVHLWQFARSFFETIGTVISFEERQTFTFRPHARACVLVDTNKELPKKLEIKIGGRVMYEIKILVLGLPNACFRCKQSGHFIRNCPYKVAGEKRGGTGNEESKKQKEASKGQGTEVVVDMEGVEEIGTTEKAEGRGSKDEDKQKEKTYRTIGEGEEGEVVTKEAQKRIPEVRAREKERGIEKENIPPVSKNVGKPKEKERARNGKEQERVREEEMSVALIPYSSPPPPTIGDFLMEALEGKEDEQAHGFQVVRRKSKRFPLVTGAREEPRSKGKVQRLCLEWDAKNSS